MRGSIIRTAALGSREEGERPLFHWISHHSNDIPLSEMGPFCALHKHAMLLINSKQNEKYFYSISLQCVQFLRFPTNDPANAADYVSTLQSRIAWPCRHTAIIP